MSGSVGQSPAPQGDRADANGDRRSGRVACARVLERDRELGLRVPVSAITRARAELIAPVLTFDPGIWEAPAGLDGGGLGFLVLEGLLARDVVLAGVTCTELLGEGDLVDPAGTPGPEALVGYEILWHALQRTSVAVLDGNFARSLVNWPQVSGALLERTVRRLTRMAVHRALLQLSPVETRLLVLFWFLAERWGRVTSDGISLRLQLTHQLIGQLVGSKRASVTTALHNVSDSGRVIRRADGTWLLRGGPPQDLAHLHWSSRSMRPVAREPWNQPAGIEQALN